jgi:hypothetical protein
VVEQESQKFELPNEERMCPFGLSGHHEEKFYSYTPDVNVGQRRKQMLWCMEAAICIRNATLSINSQRARTVPPTFHKGGVMRRPKAR